MGALERAIAVREAGVSMTLNSRRDGMTLRLQAPPELYQNSQGQTIGVHVWVKLYDSDRKEVPIDPHRIIINPPTRTARKGEMVLDPGGALQDAIWESVLSAPNPAGWRTKGTVTTVFAGTADGVVNSATGLGGTYANARAGVNLVATTANTTYTVGQEANASSNFQCNEVFVSFDTSSITDTDVVSAVTLDMWLTADLSTTDFTVEAREKDWGASLTTADWVAGASLSGQTLLAELNSSGIGSTGAYKTFTSQAAFLTATNIKTGTVYVMLCSSRQTAGSSPSTPGSELLTFSAADETGTTQDPKLTITHASLAVAPPMFQNKPMRIWRKR